MPVAFGPRDSGRSGASDGDEAEEEHLPILLFDGVCALCNGTVRVVLRLDRRARIRFAPLGGDYAAHVLERHSEARGIDSLILVEPSPSAGGTTRDVAGGERVLVKSDAVLRLAHHLGGVWRIAGMLRLVPRPVRDWLYDRIAAHRYRLFGRLARRPDPPSGVEARFLD